MSDPYRDRVLAEVGEMYTNDPSPWWRDDGWKGLDPGPEWPDRDDYPDATDLRELERERKAAQRRDIDDTLQRLYGSTS